MTTPAYLIFDIETIADGDLVQKLKFPNLNPIEAVDAYKAELLETTGRDFIPHTFHIPISVAIAKVDRYYELIGLVSLDRGEYRSEVIANDFWTGWHRYGKPTFVTFNGRGFDIPVMEMAAYRYGIDVHDWFDNSGPSYKHLRNRYNTNSHLDLQDSLSNFGATRIPGGLNLMSNLAGSPGKMDVDGSMVQDMWNAGSKDRIDDYCLCDVLDTYFVFLRHAVMHGKIGLDREAVLKAHAKSIVKDMSIDNSTLKSYYDLMEKQNV